MKKRLLALLMVFAMLMTLVPTAFAEGETTSGASAAVATIGTTNYETLAAAVAAANPGDTITLLSDATGCGIGTFVTPGTDKIGVKDFTIDFAGYTYTCNGPATGSMGTESQAFHLEKGANVTLKNGTITSTSGSGVKMMIQNYCNLTLDNLTVDGRNMDGEAPYYTISNNCGAVAITGKSNIIAKQGGYAFDVCWAPNKGYSAGTQVTVNTEGTIDGNIQFDLWGADVETACLSTLAIQNCNLTGMIVVDANMQKYAENVTVSGGAFTDLNNAIAYAANDATIKLSDDVTADVVIPADKTVTIDLNGHTLTNKTAVSTIVNNGTLTVQDSSATKTGKVDNTTHGKGAVMNNVGATATLESGTFTRSKEAGKSKDDAGGNSWYTLCNHGAMTINPAVTVENNGSYSSMIENGWQKATENTTADVSTLTINGGVFNGGLYNVKNDDYGSLSVNGGVFDGGAFGSILNWNVTTAASGKFGVGSVGGYSMYNAWDSTLAEETHTAYEAGSLTVTGGTLDGSIQTDTGATTTMSNVKTTVTNETELAAAVAAGGTVTLGTNITLTQALRIANGQSITLNLNGKTLSSTVDPTFSITHGTLKVSNGTIEQTAQLNDYFVLKGSATPSDANYTNLIVASDVTLKNTLKNTSASEVWASYGFNVNTPTKTDKFSYGVTVYFDGTVTSDDTLVPLGGYVSGNIQATTGCVPEITFGPHANLNGDIYAAGYAKWTFNGGTYTGASAVSLKAGEFTINDGTFTATGPYYDPAAANSNGSEDTGAAIGITSNPAYAGNIDIAIKGGTFVSQNGNALYEGIAVKNNAPITDTTMVKSIAITGGTFTGATDKAAISVAKYADKFITGGTFSSDPTAYLASGLVAVKGDGGVYTITDKATAAAAVVEEVKNITDATTAENKAAINAAVEAVKASNTAETAEKVGTESLKKLDDLYVAANSEKIAAPAVTTAPDAGVAQVTATGLALSAPNDNTERVQAVLKVVKSTTTTTEADVNGNIPADAGVKVTEGTAVVPMDISLDIVKANGQETVTANIQPKAPIVITLGVPDAFAGKEDTIRILHDHEGTKTVITPTISNDKAQMSFTVTQLSEFVAFASTPTVNANTFEVKMAPAAASYKLNDAIPVAVTVTPGATNTDTATMVDVFVTYDATHLTYVNATDCNVPESTAGKLHIVKTVISQTNATDTFTLGTLNFTAKAVTDANGIAAFGMDVATNDDAITTGAGYENGSKNITITTDPKPVITDSAAVITIKDGTGISAFTATAYAKKGTDSTLYTTSACTDVYNLPTTTVTALSGYHFHNAWNLSSDGSGAAYGADTVFTQDTTIYAIGTPVYAVTADVIDLNTTVSTTAAAAGSVTEDTAKVVFTGLESDNTVDKNGSFTFTASAADGYQIDSVTVNGTKVAAANDIYTVSNVTNAKAIVVNTSVKVTIAATQKTVAAATTNTKYSAYTGDKTLVKFNFTAVTDKALAFNDATGIYATAAYTDANLVSLIDLKNVTDANAIAAALKATLKVVAGTQTTFTYDGKINTDDRVNISDAQNVYDFSTLSTLHWSPAEVKLLAADLAHDGELTNDDVTAVLKLGYAWMFA